MSEFSGGNEEDNYGFGDEEPEPLIHMGRVYPINPSTLIIRTYRHPDNVFNHALVLPTDYGDHQPSTSVYILARSPAFQALLGYALASSCEIHLNVPQIPQSMRELIIRGEMSDLPRGRGERGQLFYQSEIWEATPPPESE